MPSSVSLFFSQHFWTYFLYFSIFIIIITFIIPFIIIPTSTLYHDRHHHHHRHHDSEQSIDKAPRGTPFPSRNPAKVALIPFNQAQSACFINFFAANEGTGPALHANPAPPPGEIFILTHKQSESVNMADGWKRRPDPPSIPLLFWHQLEYKKLESNRLFSSVYSAFLRLPNGHCMLVALKVPNMAATASRKVLKEARAMNALKGIPGVPRLYGVTAPSPRSAIVMSFCPGVTLDHYQTVGTAKVYLSALHIICGTLRQMHERDVTHGHVEPFNILVVEADREEATFAFLVDFWLANINGSEEDKKFDAEMLFSLILEIGDVIEEQRPKLYERCLPLITLTDISLYRIEVALEAALYVNVKNLL